MPSIFLHWVTNTNTNVPRVFIYIFRMKKTKHLCHHNSNPHSYTKGHFDTVEFNKWIN